MKLILVAPPWQLFNRPSIQLGALKAFIRSSAPDIAVQCFHPYLTFAKALGFTEYHAISQSSWASEAVGAALLFPENRDACRDIFVKAMRSRGVCPEGVSPADLFGRAVDLLGSHVESFVSELDVHDVLLAGFTACLNQFSASILTARTLKAKYTKLPVVVGGTSCSGSAAPSLLRCFSFVDYVISGEGERPLLNLCNVLSGSEEELLPSVFSSKHGGSNRTSQDCPADSRVQLGKLDSLPTPDFDDYFRELENLPAESRFYPVLPVEASRGCWWGRCNFCNLNLQWRGYRARKPEDVAACVDALSRRYGVIDFAFMDNVLPRRDAAAIFKQLARHGRDYSFFAELRAVHSRQEYRIMASGGLKTLQVGIEALSAGQLERLGKGSRVIDNIAAMRHAFEAGIELDGNLILHYPGSTGHEVRETLRMLEFVWPYRPLKTVSFWLGHGSPAEQQARALGLRRIAAHPWWKRMFMSPDGLMPRPLILWYASDRERQHRLWKPVEREVRRLARLRREAGVHKPMLSCRDGGDFLAIRQVRPGGSTRMHRLKGISRKLYLFCMDIRDVEDVMEMAGGEIDLGQLQRFVQGLVNLRLMFSDGKSILSLAVHERSFG